MLNVVVFPEPLGPMSPKISPFSTSKVTSLTAVRPPNFLTSFSTRKYATSDSLSRWVDAEHVPLDLLPVADDAVGQVQDDDDDQDSEPEHVRLVDRVGQGSECRGSRRLPKRVEEAEEPRPEDLLEGHHDERSDGGPVNRSHAAHDTDQDRHDGDVMEVEDDVGVDEPHVVHVQGAGDPGPEGRVRKGEHLIEVRVDPETLRGVLVLPDGDEVVPGFGANDHL